MENYKASYILRGLLFAFLFYVLGTYIGLEIPWATHFLSWFYGIIVGIIFFALVIHTLWEFDQRSQKEYEELLKGSFLPIRFPRTIALVVILIIIGHRTLLGFKAGANVYNQNVLYGTQYTQKSSQLLSLYDNMWKSYKIQKENTDLSKETILNLTQIIFENRRDGNQVAWKWLQENQPVPYGEFTKLYDRLSDYAVTKRDEYYGLEVQRQQIIQSQHNLIYTFPNNWYNLFLGIKPLEYKYGFLSDSTKAIFAGGTENP